jgi:hypothetical protein
VLSIRSFREVDCDTGHYLVVAVVRDRVSVSKLSPQNFNLERYILKQLQVVKVRKQYLIKVSKSWAGLEKLDYSRGINNCLGSY